MALLESNLQSWDNGNVILNNFCLEKYLIKDATGRYRQLGLKKIFIILNKINSNNTNLFKKA